MQSYQIVLVLKACETFAKRMSNNQIKQGLQLANQPLF